ncbi:MAG: STAS domain-containing protein [Acidobacteriota bacterium]
MRVQTEVVGPVTLVHLTGDLVIGDPEATFKQEMSALVKSGKINLVIDLASVHYLDSTGLGSLVRTYTSTKRAGGTTKLLNVGERNRKILEITRLSTVFEIFEDRAAALSSF